MLAGLPGFAQNPEWIIYNDENTGLHEHDYVHDIAFEADGSKWFGL